MGDTQNLGDSVFIHDDGPAVTVNDSSGTFDAGAQGTWTDLPGTDGFEALNVTLDSYEIADGAPISVNTALTKTGDFVFSGSITADFTPNDGQDNPQDIDFTLTFDPDSDSYDLQLDTPPTTVVLQDTSQGQLKAGGPDPVQTLIFGGSEQFADDVVFFGVVATAPKENVSGDLNDLEDLIVSGSGDRTEDQIQAYLSPTNQIPTLINSGTQMNVSTSGIGINNNNLDGNNTTGVQSDDESFIFNPEQDADSVFVYIDNAVGGYSPNSGEQLYYTVYYTDGSVSADILVTAGMLQPATRGDPLVPKAAQGGQYFEIDGGAKDIDAVQLTMGVGTVKIPVIQWSVEQAFEPDDLKLNLTAEIVDADGDSASDAFSIDLSGFLL